MSPVSKSKSKDKKAGKEPSKTSKPSSHVNSSSGTPASGYNPMLGTFHTFETAPIPSASPLLVNGRFRNIDDTDDHNGNSSVNGIEYDSISNNDSWSGESEDHKDKTSQPTQRQESIPGADNDKREKIRQKNERKHQRQKERRAQELHEKCSGYLMSRKLEALAQQLVAMGFSQERATMALIMNEGRVEESISWFFEGGEEDRKMEHNLDGGGNLKIDISEELARITDIEIRFKVSKQEVERAVVSCEGDLDKAEEMFKAQKEDPPSVSLKPEENNDHTSLANSKLPISPNPSRIQLRPTSSTITLQKRDEKYFSYTKAPATAGLSSIDPVPKSTLLLKKIPPKSDWVKPQQIAAPPEKKWVNGSNPSASFSLASSAPAPIKTEARFVAIGNELKNLQLGSVKEPVVMQRPQSANPKQAPSMSLSSSPPGTGMGWYPSTVETMKAHPSVAMSRSLSPNDISSNPFQSLQNQINYPPNLQYVSESQGIARGNGNGFGGRGTLPSIAAASSLGLFSGIGANGSSSSVDWNTGSSTLQFDYTSIDWSLDRGSLSSRPPSRFANYSMMQDNAHSYDSFVYNPPMRNVLPSGNGVPIPGLQDRVASGDQTGAGSREWTSPFEEKDLFSLPRQFVSSPTL